MRFDFAVKKKKKIILIEYNGRQHYKEISFFGGKEAFIKLRENDKIKVRYCEDNNIELIVISYKQFDVIENLLNSRLGLRNG